jgi:hypothetical protein
MPLMKACVSNIINVIHSVAFAISLQHASVDCERSLVQLDKLDWHSPFLEVNVVDRVVRVLHTSVYFSESKSESDEAKEITSRFRKHGLEVSLHDFYQAEFAQFGADRVVLVTGNFGSYFFLRYGSNLALRWHQPGFWTIDSRDNELFVCRLDGIKLDRRSCVLVSALLLTRQSNM